MVFLPAHGLVTVHDSRFYVAIIVLLEYNDDEPNG